MGSGDNHELLINSEKDEVESGRTKHLNSGAKKVIAGCYCCCFMKYFSVRDVKQNKKLMYHGVLFHSQV